MPRNYMCNECGDFGKVGWFLLRKVCPQCNGNPFAYWEKKHEPRRAGPISIQPSPPPPPRVNDRLDAIEHKLEMIFIRDMPPETMLLYLTRKEARHARP